MLRIIRESFLLQVKESLSRATFRFTLFLQPIFNCLLLYFVLRTRSSLEMGKYLLVNVSVMNLWSAIVYGSASDLDREKRMGTLGSNFAAPADFRLIYFGKVVANIFLSMFSLIITFLFIKYFLRLSVELPNFVLLIFLFLVMLFSFAILSILLGYIFLLYRNSLTWMNILEYPIYVLSGIAMPTKELPKFIQPICDILPTKWMVSLLKLIIAKNVTLGKLIKSKSLIIIVLLSIIYLLLVVVLNRTMENRVMSEGKMEVY